MPLDDSWLIGAVRILEKYGGLHQLLDEGHTATVTIWLTFRPLSMANAFEQAQRAVTELAGQFSVLGYRLEYGPSYFGPVEATLEVVVLKGES